MLLWLKCMHQMARCRLPLCKVGAVQHAAAQVATESLSVYLVSRCIKLLKRMSSSKVGGTARIVRPVWVQAAQPAAARGPGAELRFQAGGATSSGPAAGLGYEIILQAFNWESHRESWYQVLHPMRRGSLVC